MTLFCLRRTVHRSHKNRGVFLGPWAAFEAASRPRFGRDDVSRRGISAEGELYSSRIFALPMNARSCGGSHILSLSLDDVYRPTFPVCFALPIFGRVRLPVGR